MNLVKKILSAITAATMIISIGIINASALTKIATSSITDMGEVGLNLSEVRSIAAAAFCERHFDVSGSDFDLDTSKSTAPLSNSVETESNKVYVLVCDNIDTESNYTSDVTMLTYTYEVSNLYEITINSITIEDSVTGKTKAKIQELAAAAFNENHYDISSSDFEQESGTTLSSSVTTQAGNTYVFVCNDVRTESEYTTKVVKLTYKYVASASGSTSGPAYGSNLGWTAIKNALDSKTSGTALITMNNTTMLPSDILSSIKGKNIDLTLDFGKYTWTINGNNVTTASSIDLKVYFGGSDISSSIVKTLAGTRETTQLQLSYSGNLGFKGALTTCIDADDAGKYANLYYYNPTTKSLEYQSNSIISNTGFATLNFTHASDYVIVIDNTPMGNQLSAGESIQDIAKPIQ